MEESDENTDAGAETAIWWGCSYIGTKAGVHKVIFSTSLIDVEPMSRKTVMVSLKSANLYRF